MSNLYREEILEYYRDPVNKGSIIGPDYSLHETNASCGDSITLYLKLDKNGRISSAKFEGSGCAISVASTSMLTEHLEGKTIKEAKKITLKDVYEMLGGSVNPGRIKCASICLKALEKIN